MTDGETRLFFREHSAVTLKFTTPNIGTPSGSPEHRQRAVRTKRYAQRAKSEPLGIFPHAHSSESGGALTVTV